MEWFTVNLYDSVPRVRSTVLLASVRMLRRNPVTSVALGHAEAIIGTVQLMTDYINNDNNNMRSISL